MTFLENTESYRRDLRRAEYGDERDPKMRAFLRTDLTARERREDHQAADGRERAQRPARAAGPRREQIVAAVKQRGAPVSWIVAKDEGHGFAKKPNADYQFYATVEFLRGILKIDP